MAKTDRHLTIISGGFRAYYPSDITVAKDAVHAFTPSHDEVKEVWFMVDIASQYYAFTSSPAAGTREGVSGTAWTKVPIGSECTIYFQNAGLGAANWHVVEFV